MEMNYKDRIYELRSLLLEHNRRYYVEDSPSISDYEYDMLMQELVQLEKSHPELDSPDSPSHRVGSDISSSYVAYGGEDGNFARYAHRFPMLSLGNTYNIGEVEEFASRAAKLTDGSFTYCCELKFDGTSISLTYENGVLVHAVTRGDGSVGDDVTANALKIKNIPHKLKGSGYPSYFEIRGEIYMPYKAFEALCRSREEEGEEPFANPRNAASGSLKLTDSSQVAKRGLECTLYHMVADDLPFKTHSEALAKAAEWGLPVSDKLSLCKDISQVKDFIDYWDKERHNLPFATDGVVVKINELDVQRHLGYTSKFPRWAVAYKFKAEQALAQVLSIDYQLGRTGAVTPVANLTPVPLGGTTVKRASLHNADQMEALDIRIGDWVYVEKGGEIIPKITAVELERRPVISEKPVFPTQCPDCGTPLVRSEGEARWYCPNQTSCPTQLIQTLVHFLSRKAMNVLAGDATVRAMYNAGLVRMPADFYDLRFDQLFRLDGWKEKSCERFLKSLEKSRKVPFGQVLYALGIRNVGETTAKTLASHFGNIDALAAAGKDELMAVGDIGGTIADSILAYFADPVNQTNLERLKAAGLQFSNEAKALKDDKLKGMSIVITGSYSISRDAMKAIIEAHGGKASGSISSKTAMVIVGEKPGPEKIKKARDLGVRMVSEAEFYEIAGEIMAKPDEQELTLF